MPPSAPMANVSTRRDDFSVLISGSIGSRHVGAPVDLVGRNSAFDHAGNVAIALVAGAVGYAFSQRAVFLLVPVFAVLTGIAVLSIPAKAIDYNRARDLDSEPGAAKGAPGVAGYGI